MPLVGERINKLTEAAPMLGFLFVDEADFERDPDDVAKLRLLLVDPAEDFDLLAPKAQAGA